MKRAIIVAILLLVMGCQGKTETIDLKPITLAEAYPGDISEVGRVELLDGSTGERKTIKDRQKIQHWIGQIKDIQLTPDINQEGRTGFIFGISLYKGEEMKLGFIPNQIHHIYYESNPEFEERIRSFFEEQFGRNY
ncbi:hypothetical protein GE107_09090 [Cohnella sp. CFH 77786]|uniref:hypothetical protein n=1 Tax=Cohnella sp. CFH 77786 TaxID=2662265 RepID=UPI001C60B3D6|nr:hypothetical protein [Cohnella sp. CFH 77786]MBW5446212.1 hypothetical protein [Cohnella sp. CFH 77786]